jgi:predicted RNase H-like HicB family nuclease
MVTASRLRTDARRPAARDAAGATINEMEQEEAGMTYTAVLTPGDDGWICAQVAEVPEAISQGRTLEEATAIVTEALEIALEWRRDEGEPFPSPAEVTVTPVTVSRL